MNLMCTTRRSVFWCARADRDVEVEFETRGVFWTVRGVKSCSVFAPPTAVICHRRCLDSTFRRQWPPALPVYTRVGRIPERGVGAG